MCELDLEMDLCFLRMILKFDLYLVIFIRIFERSYYEKFRKVYCCKKFVCCVESLYFDEKMCFVLIRSCYESEVIVIFIFFFIVIYV